MKKITTNETEMSVFTAALMLTCLMVGVYKVSCAIFYIAFYAPQRIADITEKILKKVLN